MIEGLNTILADSGLPDLAELGGLLEELLGGRESSGRLVEQKSLGPRELRVFRLRFDLAGQARSVVVKRLKPEVARRNELVGKRWLPAIGMEDGGVPLLGSVAGRSGRSVWHVYEDLGNHELDPLAPDREHVSVAVELIARMHTQFAGHALLGEVRLHGGDLGIHFCESNVRDAIYSLEAWKPEGLGLRQPSAALVSGDGLKKRQRTAAVQDASAALAPRALQERLLERLYNLRDQLPRRAHALAKWGGPETLLHGDLWAINVFVIPTAGGLRARLIDWDHAAVGPATYDLSTFLLRFPSEHRAWVLELYRQAVAEAGWRLPDEHDLNSLFETHEYARFANRIIWPAIALAQDDGEWGIEALAEIEEWFEQFGPVLPVETEVAA